MADNEITFDNLPEAVGYLIQEIGEIKKIMSQQNETCPNNNFPIGIDEACQIVGKAKSTIYTLVQKRMIPCYKIGKKLYFYEYELLEWIATGRKKSLAETKAELEKEMYQGVRYSIKKIKILNRIIMTKKQQHLKIMSLESLQQFENFDKNLLDKNDKFYLDLFLISFYSGGVSLKNLANLKKEDINGNQLNCKEFEYPLVDSVTLNKKAIDIIERYKNESYEDFVLPIFTFKHEISGQKEGRIKRLAKDINLTLRKISEILNLEEGHPTLRSAKYSFIAKLSRDKIHPMVIYAFAGMAALSVELYLLEQETPSKKEARRKEMLEKINREFSPCC